MKRLTTEEALEKAAPYQLIAKAKIEQLYKTLINFDWEHGTDLEINSITLKTSIRVGEVDLVIFRRCIDKTNASSFSNISEKDQADILELWTSLAQAHVFNFIQQGIY